MSKAKMPKPRSLAGDATRTIDLSRTRSLSPKDQNLNGIFPDGFSDLYEIHSYRNAARILAAASKADFDQLLEELLNFRITTADVVAPGGNKSKVAKSIEDRLNPIGWIETSVRADLVVQKIYREPVPRAKAAASGTVSAKTKTKEVVDEFVVIDFINGHKIDFLKNRVAFDLEWNSKDQTFDRDLYAARTFYECGLVDAAILLTRSADLAPIFTEISARVRTKDFGAKFGASTTWMGKLTKRLDAGRGGGCPVLALGIKPSVIGDFEAWKTANARIQAPTVIDPDDETEEDASGEPISIE